MSTVELDNQADIQSLYTHHHSWLKTWLRRRLGNDSDAADLAQDTFVRLLVNRQSLKNPESPRGYLQVIAKRLCIDLWRRKSIEQAWLEIVASRPEAVHISPEEHAIVLETFYELDEMLHRLPQNVATAFMLAQVDGLTYREIAEQMSVSERSVKNWMAKAMLECLLLEARFHESLTP
ncbi:sigma-70 family RNA polymerase sigma factor [Cellvibrio polysaccharolyticus]|uniref:RNA polymerase subunit sigma n=1 Tax=Cellvibrio polysaccharolyticus TaxID=2082724 RepID=A0A928V2Y7_9GAMM|nr:sigma-70 family RNA polymerase sigma factor [Cellvibrio polysaccharolyticus]MBE8717818.1 RNA polymerase subunit sigma [Cellvibrio polysaccharolyticus]